MPANPSFLTMAADPLIKPLYCLSAFGLFPSSINLVLIASEGVTANAPSHKPAKNPAATERGSES